MSIALLLANGNGALYPNSEKGEGKPVLVGFVEFPLDDKKDGNKLRLEAAAWIKTVDAKDKEGNFITKEDGVTRVQQNFYSLNVGGINATLFPEEAKKSDKAPDYAGSFGFNRELRIAAWRKEAEGTGNRYLSIAIEERKQKPNTPSDAGESAPGFAGGVNFL